MPLLHEVLAALRDVGLRVVNMGERPGLEDARWTVQLSNSAFGDPHAEIYWATGPDATAAVLECLRKAGVNLEE